LDVASEVRGIYLHWPERESNPDTRSSVCESAFEVPLRSEVFGSGDENCYPVVIPAFLSDMEPSGSSGARNAIEHRHPQS
jgi:hypothetical protein